MSHSSNDLLKKFIRSVYYLDRLKIIMSTVCLIIVFARLFSDVQNYSTLKTSGY